MPSGFEWIVAPEDAFAELFDHLTQEVRRAVSIVLDRRKVEIQAWMQENAPWDDRTGNARQTLWTEFHAAFESMSITFGHGVEYGWWLEMANAGRYSIIMPALDHWKPIIMADIKAIMGQ